MSCVGAEAEADGEGGEAVGGVDLGAEGAGEEAEEAEEGKALGGRIR